MALCAFNAHEMELAAQAAEVVMVQSECDLETETTPPLTR